MEPVGSKSLVDRHHLDVSPATIRNDMAVLEEQGYISQPHTSAGRIPTDKGYRLFVDRLSGIKPLSAAEHIELVPMAPQRLLLVLITDSGRVEQRAVELPEPIEDTAVAHLRAVLNACLDGRRLSEAASVVTELPEQVQSADRHNAAAVFSVILDTLV